MKLDEFVVEFLLKDKGFDKGVDNYDSKLKKLTSTLGKVAGAAAAFFTSGAIVRGIDAATEKIDKLGKTSEKLGTDFEELQELGFAAEQNGIKVDTFNVAIQRMTRRIAEAANAGKGEAIPALEALGLSAEKLNQLSTGDRLNAIADAMSRIPDQGERVRIAFKLFDTEGVDMVRVLQNGSDGLMQLRQEARDLGIVLGKDYPKQSAIFQDAVNRGRRIIDALRTKALIKLAPVITKVIDRFVAWWKINGELVSQRIDRFIDAVGRVLETLIFIVGRVWQAIKFLIDQFMSLNPVIRYTAFLIPLLTKGLGLLFKLLRASVFVAFLIALEDFITYLRGGESAIGHFLAKLEEIHPVLDDVAKGLAGLLIAGLAYRKIALLVAGFLKLAAVRGAVVGFMLNAVMWVNRLKTVFIGLWAVIMANPVVAIITAIVAVIIGAAYLIIKNWEKVKAFFADLWEKVKGYGLDAWDSIKNKASEIAASITNIWTEAVNGLRSLWKGFVDWITDLVPDFVIDGVSKAKGFLGFGDDDNGKKLSDKAEQVAQTVAKSKAIRTAAVGVAAGASMAVAASPTTGAGIGDGGTQQVSNDYQIEVTIQGDPSGLTEDDITRGITKALTDKPTDGLRNNVGIYR